MKKREKGTTKRKLSGSISKRVSSKSSSAHNLPQLKYGGGEVTTGKQGENVENRDGRESVQKQARSPTKYELRLYDVCRCIPAGKVTTYGAIATVLNSSARAVGQALRRNPYAPEVPCHRVIAANKYIGGFSGSWGFDCMNGRRKIELLRSEGVYFDKKGKLVEQSQLLDAAELKNFTIQDKQKNRNYVAPSP